MLCLVPTGLWAAFHYFWSARDIVADQERATGVPLESAAWRQWARETQGHQDLRGRQSAAALRRALLRVRQADDRPATSSGIGEAYCVPFHPKLVAQMIEDVFARYLEGEDPHDIEKIWRRVYSRGFHAASGPHADGSAQRARDGLLGHHRQGGGSAGLQASGRTRARAAAHLHLYLRRGPGDATRSSIRTRISPPTRALEYLRAGIHGDQVRPGRALFRIRRAAAVARGAGAVGSDSHASCARRSAARRTCCSARTDR